MLFSLVPASSPDYSPGGWLVERNGRCPECLFLLGRECDDAPTDGGRAAWVPRAVPKPFGPWVSH